MKNRIPAICAFIGTVILFLSCCVNTFIYILANFILEPYEVYGTGTQIIYILQDLGCGLAWILIAVFFGSLAFKKKE